MPCTQGSSLAGRSRSRPARLGPFSTQRCKRLRQMVPCLRACLPSLLRLSRLSCPCLSHLRPTPSLVGQRSVSCTRRRHRRLRCRGWGRFRSSLVHHHGSRRSHLAQILHLPHSALFSRRRRRRRLSRTILHRDSGQVRQVRMASGTQMESRPANVLAPMAMVIRLDEYAQRQAMV